MANAVNRLAVVIVVALVAAAAQIASAQRTTSTDVRSFEVVAVAGNKLVVKEQSGTREYTVPDDFRFDVEGKKVAVTALKPGMKGEATFTTITTSTPVYVTEVREAEVVQASGSSLLVRGRDGFRMYSPGDVEKRGITIMKNGRAVEFSDLHKGDRLTATIVTEGPPKTLTETQVQAVLSSPAPALPPPVPAPVPAPVPTEAAVPPAAAPTAAAASNAAQPTPPVAAKTENASGMGMILVIALGIVVVAAIWYFASRRQART